MANQNRTKNDLSSLTTQSQAADIVAALEYANAAYRKGNPVATDAEYDSWVLRLGELDPTNEFLTSLESEPSFGGAKVIHPVPMLSLAKAYTVEEVSKFVSRVSNVWEGLGNDKDQLKFKIMPKLDGIAGRLDGGVLGTRGDGLVGSNVTHIFDLGVVKLNESNEPMVGEIVMTKSYADSVDCEYDRSRNVCAGICSADTIKEFAQAALDSGSIHFVSFDQLASEVRVGVDWCEDIESIEKVLQDKCDYPTDGVVITVLSADLIAEMGANSREPRYSIAKKSQGKSVATTVESVTWQLGRSGRLTPVMELNPIKVDGCVISRVTGHHAGWVRSNGAGVSVEGEKAEVQIVRSGAVIPKVASVEKPVEVEMPESCPCCRAPLVWRKDFLYCSDNKNCPDQLREKLVYFFKLIEVDLFGPAACEKLIDFGMTTVLDVYRASTVDFVSAGFGDKQALNLREQLDESIVRPLDDYKLMAAFGVHLLGRGDSRRVLRVHRINEICDVSVDQLVQIDGIGQLTAESVVSDIAAISSLIKAVLQLGFSLTHQSDIVTQASSGGFDWVGKKVVFTGKLSLGRNEMRSEADNLGLTTQSSLSAKTDYLIAGEKSGASKIAKAEKLGVQVLTEDEYRNMIG